MGEHGAAMGTVERAIRRIMLGLLVLLAALLLIGAVRRWDRLGSLHDWRWQIILTVIGLAVGAWMGTFWTRAGQRFRKTATGSAVAILFSEACYLILVWTDWKMHPVVWRFWWVSFVAAITGTHVIWLRMAAADDRRKLRRVTVGAAVFSAAMLGGLGFQKQILGQVGDGYVAAVAAGLAMSIAGSVMLWLRGLRLRRTGVPRAVKIGWLVAAQAALLGGAFYLGRITVEPPALYERGASALARVPAGELNLQASTDLARLRSIISPGLDELEQKARDLARQLHESRAAQRRDRFTPEEDNAVRGQFMTYLAYRDALLRLVATYAGYEAVANPQTQARCMLVGYVAGSMLYESSATLVSLFKDDALVRGKLNEADPAWGLPAGIFDRILQNVGNPRHAETLAEISAYFDQHSARWAQEQVFPPEDFGWIGHRIARSRQKTAGLGGAITEPKWKQIVARVKRDTYEPWYATQSVVSTWIGDTRLVRWEPLIRVEQIKQLQSHLRPGDILLERRNWFLSNAFLPGFWPHSALYVGTVQDLEKLGLVKKVDGRWTAEGEIARHLEEYLRRAADGQEHTVIEAISDGVVFNSLTESMHADYVAVLRPRLSDEQKAQAIARAFSHVGKPYDFEFSFATADKLVCTELVYRSYYGLVNLEEPYLQRIAGRPTLPALEIARKFRAERSAPTRQLDFVAFLDGDVAEHTARFAGEDVFCQTIERAKAFNE